MLDFVFYTTFSEDIQVNFEYLNLERAIDPILNVSDRDTSNTLLTQTPGILDRVRNSQSDYERVDEFKVNFESISKYLKKERDIKNADKEMEKDSRHPQISVEEDERKKKKENSQRMSRIAKWGDIFTFSCKKIKLMYDNENLDESFSDNSYPEDISDFESLDSFTLDSEVIEDQSNDENLIAPIVKKNQLTIRKEFNEKKDENERKEFDFFKAVEQEDTRENKEEWLIVEKKDEEKIVADISLEIKSKKEKENSKEEAQQ